ncbi:hypothetical protein [Microlunatus parietis]|uniref:Uncharacterized protein n=1 Tax=Microlunatus parietis TaxID=682979 RepID=A0A7Y9I8F2_9ACTN|nr:hypothetical protein [Microlunatus parietis]NYE72127.1 hypothetical protein [Microlunatus parietis]
MTAAHPYVDARVATRHAKQQALGPAIARIPGLRLDLADDFDADQLGAFARKNLTA